MTRTATGRNRNSNESYSTTMTPKKTKPDWETERRLQAAAGEQADALVTRLGLTVPIDPFKVIASEAPFLVAGGRDFGGRFDGKLKYNREKNRFLLLFNTKYDAGLPPGTHHPRTRFSIAHELGHYFNDAHHDYLLRGGKPHPSSSEYRTNVQMEREADAFAASLLLPTQFAGPVVNKHELTLERLDAIAGDFQASLVSTAIRAVRLSGDPCAVAGLRDGEIAWMFPSDRLIEARCYPGKQALESAFAQSRWKAFAASDNARASRDGMLRHWFQLFGREEELHDVEVTEQFLPVRVMDTLVVLLTMDDGDLFRDEEEEDDESDD
jgi:IrrE N-terminal-like domain